MKSPPSIERIFSTMKSPPSTECIFSTIWPMKIPPSFWVHFSTILRNENPAPYLQLITACRATHDTRFSCCSRRRTPPRRHRRLTVWTMKKQQGKQHSYEILTWTPTGRKYPWSPYRTTSGTRDQFLLIFKNTGFLSNFYKLSKPRDTRAKPYAVTSNPISHPLQVFHDGLTMFYRTAS